MPPIAAKAAVNGHPSTGFARADRLLPLPKSALLKSVIAIDYIPVVRKYEIIFLVRNGGKPLIVEVRSYRTKPGKREEFLRFFEEQAVPAQKEFGIQIMGPFVDLENPNKFVWLRGFDSLADRDEVKEAFYSGAVWKEELEAIAMPMLDSYDVVLCETVSGFFADRMQ